MLVQLMKRTVGESSIYFSGQMVVAAISFLAIPVFARIFVPAEYGLISLALLVAGMGSILTGNWLTSSVNRFFPYYRRMGKLDTFYSTLFICMVLTFCAFYALGTVFYIFLQGRIDSDLLSLAPLIAILIPLMASFDIFLTNFRIRQEPRLYVLFNLSKTVLSLAMGFSLALLVSARVFGFFSGYTVATAILCAPMFRMLFLKGRHISFRFASLPAAREFAIFGFPAAVATIGTWVLTGADRFVIDYFWGTTPVGLYSMGYTIGSSTVGMVVSSLMLSFGPSLINTWESDSRELTGPLLSQLTRLQILITLPAAVGVSVLAAPLFRLLTTPPYYSGTVVVPFLAFGAFIYGLSLLAYTGLGLAKRTDIVARNYIIAAIFNLVLNIALVPIFGFIAAAATTTTTYCALLLLNAYSSRSYMRWAVIPRSALNTVLASLIMGCTAFLTAHVLPCALMECVGGAVAGVTTYVLMLLVLRELSSEDKAQIKSLIRESLRR